MRRVSTRRQVLGLAAAAVVGTVVLGERGWSLLSRRGPGPEAGDMDELRRWFVERGPLAYERISSPDYAENADQIVAEGWSPAPDAMVSLDLPIDWIKGTANRSWNFHFHAWDWMAPVLGAFERTGERRYLDWSVARAASWARTFNQGGARGTMAWYDMAIGLRGYRLAYVLEHAVRYRADPTVIEVLLACVRRHQRELAADRAFNPHTNHGFYVAAGQLAFSRRLRDLPGMDAMAAQGGERMRVVAQRQFAADGGHREHSTDYHRMLVDSFRELIRNGLLTDPEVRRRIERADGVLGWFIQPDGEMVQVGDSAANQMRFRGVRTSSPTTEFLVSVGRRGSPNRRRLKVLPDSGYAIVRSPQPRGTDDHRQASYLLLAAAFHSRTHKHADDLSIVWFDRQRQILIDAGRYGYVHDTIPEGDARRQLGFYYDAPERQYVESTHAHNTVEADGRLHDRVGREPYGSAIAGAQERAGHFRLQAVVNHGAWRHRRDIVFRPGRWLQVTDIVTGLDGAAHDFRVWWNFPEGLEPRPAGTGRLAIDLPRSTDRLWVTELGGAPVIDPVTAQRDALRGWRSRRDLELTPAWSTGFESLGVHRHHTFHTLFHFGPEPRTAPFPHPFPQAPSVDS
jgi:hypothetical protein